jgi:hypothetical protein
MRRPVLLVAVGVIALIAVFALVKAASLLIGLVPPAIPPSTQYIPAYPNATHLDQDYTSITNVKVLDFQTSANPQTIQDYYKGILLKDGWNIDTVSVPATPDSLYFSYTQHDAGFSFALIIQQLDTGETSVHIKLVSHNLFM